MRALGVHIFAGGFTLGVERHFEVVGHLERGKYGVATFQRNRPQIPVYVDRAGKWEAALDGLKVPFVYGNPPCAPFSLAGNGAKLRGAESPMAEWIPDVVRVGRAVEAEAVVIESVRGALKAESTLFRPLWDQHRDWFTSAAWVLVNTYDHGLPQWRPRLFWLLSRERFDVRAQYLEVPKLVPTFTRPTRAAHNDEPVPEIAMDMGKALGHEFTKLFPLLEQGKRMGRLRPHEVEDVAPAVAAKMRSRTLLMHLPIRLHADQPSPAIFGSEAKYLHPTEDRLLTVRELARLCGYPDSFEWVGGVNGQLQQMGKGVCPPVGAWIAGEVAAYLKGDRAVRGPGGDMITIEAASARWTSPLQLDIYAAGA